MDLYSEEGQHNRIESPFNGVMLVTKNDKVLVKKAYGFYDKERNIKNTVDSRFMIGSITKQFTAMLIMQQVERGVIKLDKSVSDYLPYFPLNKGKQLTIHRLLSHTSGLPHYEGLRRLDVKLDDFRKNKLSPKDYVQLIAKMDLINQPGTQFYYSSQNYILLGAILEQVTGKTYATLLEENITSPLKLNNTGFTDNKFIEENVAQGYIFTESHFFKALFSSDKGEYRKDRFRDQSTTYATGGIYSTVDDLYIWSKAVKQNKLLTKEMTDKMLTPNIGGYAYGWFINHENVIRFNPFVQLIHHGGTLEGFAANIAIYQDGVTVIYLSNVTPVGSIRLTMNMHLAANNIAVKDFERDIRLPTINDDLDDFIDDGGLPALQNYYDEISRRAGYKVNMAEWGYEEMVKLYLSAGKIKQAEKFVDKLLSLYSTPNSSYMNKIGYHFLRREAYPQAIRCFKLNVKNYAYSANAHDSLAEAYLASGKTALAVTHYQKAVDLAKHNNSANTGIHIENLTLATNKLKGL